MEGDPESALLETFGFTYDGVFVLDVVSDGCFAIVEFSPADDAVTCIESASVCGKLVDELFPPVVAAALSSRYMRCVETRAVTRYEEEIELRRGRRSFSTTLVPVCDETGAVRRIVGFARDRTALREVREQLRHSQKLETVGLLAGSVAHDFNNYMTVILSYSDFLLEALDGDRLAGDVTELRRAAEGAAELARRLLALGRPQSLRPTSVDLGGMVCRLQRILRRILREDIELDIVIAPARASVWADPSGMEQAILNLVTNARDAMPHGGTLTISTNHVLVDVAGASTLDGLEPGNYVMLSVADSGDGMDASTQARLFEPFFTTKEPGRGTGLGLSIVSGIVQQNGGVIRVDSAPGKGTRFTIYLKCAEDAPCPIEPAIPASALRGTETVLLADDDAASRSIVRAILCRSGYQVLEAESADEALLVCEQYAGAIHLLLTDLTMLRMTGCTVARRLAQLRPEMKVLRMSAHPDETAGEPCLPTPITPAALCRSVREALR